jgi:UDP-GlcNAc:undecaprenyl-phosphate GlcNAc-1-phosphate transferase
MIFSVAFFAAGFFVTVLLTPWMIRLSERGVGVDEAVAARKRHKGPISRLGGVPIILALGLGIVVILTKRPQHSAQWFPILLGSVLMFGLGLWDDLRPLGARVKFVGQILIAGLCFWLGLSIDLMTYPGGGWRVELGAWSAPLTILWLIAVPNIVNLIDGFDGLAGGLGVFMAATLGVVGLLAEQYPVAWYSFTMAGALLGFLVFNFPPAKIFLGDGGAYLIGFSIAALSLTSSNKGSIAAVLLVTIVALGVPILDTSFAMTRRAFRGFPLFHADDEHIHHRLEDLGFSKRRIVLGLYGVCVVLSLLGLSIFWSQGRTIPIGIGVIFLLAVFAVRYLHDIRDLSDVREQFGRVMGQRRAVQYALLQQRVMQMELERCELAEEFWPIFHDTLRRVGFVENMKNLEGKYVKISVQNNGGEPWILYAPRNSGTDAEWQRIAECFRPIYLRAKAKWRC